MTTPTDELMPEEKTTLRGKIVAAAWMVALVMNLTDSCMFRSEQREKGKRDEQRHQEIIAAMEKQAAHH